MGTVTIGRCKCECYINYVSCDCNTEFTNEIRSERSNRFINQTSSSRTIKSSKKRSPNESTLTKLSSQKRPNSRTPSSEKYYLSEYCNITTEDSQKQGFVDNRRILRTMNIQERTKYIVEVVESSKGPTINSIDKEEVPEQDQSMNEAIRSRQVSQYTQQDRKENSSNTSQEKFGVLKKPNEKKQQQNRVKWDLPQSYYIRERQQQQQRFFV